jgi:allophanate hydrolase subunit 2
VTLELVLQGAVFRALRPGWLALAGADMGWPPGTARRVVAGEHLRFSTHRGGAFAYLAAPGGWIAPLILGSASVFVRGGLGRAPVAGDVLCCGEDPARPGWSSVVVRRRRMPSLPGAIVARIHRGPQWGEFSATAHHSLLCTPWRVSSRSDRTGARLDGGLVEVPAGVMLSEPVRPGSIQVTGSGQPVITMKDGPTVGGYPKIGWIGETECRRVAQVPPGGTIRFALMEE